jgi:pimeloyl-ACP methyl ester carboxylesterase
MKRLLLTLLAVCAALFPAMVGGFSGGAGAAESAVKGASCENSQLSSIGGADAGVPVVLVHGVSGDPSIFGDGELGGGPSLEAQIDALKGAHVWTFDYHKVSLDWVTNPDIGPALATSINCLAHATGSPAIVVDHSMGGLATEVAAAQSDTAGGTTADNIAAVVTIATPFQGSEALSDAQELINSGEVVGDLAGDDGEVAAVEALLSACAGVGQVADAENLDNPCGIVSVLHSPAGTALEYGSAQIASLPAWPIGLPVYDTAGNISLQIHFGPIKHTLAQIGDLLVTTGSATAHDTVLSPAIASCTESDLSIITSLAGKKSNCYHAKLPSNRTIDAAVISAIKSALTPGELLPSTSVATAELAQLAPGMASDIVKVPSGYEAATYDQSGNIDFWKLSTGPWRKVGVSRYPDLGPTEPPEPSVSGALLTGMSDATFIAKGYFTGDGTGNEIAFTNGPHGWGTIVPGPNNTLVPTGGTSTDNTTPGIKFDELFANNQLETIDQNPDAYTAMGPEYGLVTNWKWTGSSFSDAQDNIFTAHSASAPNWGSAAPLPSNVCGHVTESGMAGNTASPPPDGTYQAYMNVTDDKSDLHAVDVSLVQNSSGLGSLCQFSDVNQNVPTTVEVAAASGATSWMTAPIWLLRDPLMFLPEELGPPVTTSFGSSDYTYGQSPLYIPSSLGVTRLVTTWQETQPVIATIAGGKLTALALVPPTTPLPPTPSTGNTGNTGATPTTAPPPANSGNTGSTGNTGTSGTTGDTGNTD